MIPGVWLELEVMGINCPKADKVPEDWYFKRHGKKVYDRSRYQLDFRSPEAIAHANEVIDRVVGEYGVGYIKMDYNMRQYRQIKVTCGYPKAENCKYEWNANSGILSVELPNPVSARLFEIGLK